MVIHLARDPTQTTFFPYNISFDWLSHIIPACQKSLEFWFTYATH